MTADVGSPPELPWPSPNVAALHVERGGAIRSANAAGESLAGGPLAGVPLTDLLAPGQRDAVRRCLAGATARWTSLRVGVASAARSAPADYTLWTRLDGRGLLVVLEPEWGQLQRVNARLVEVSRDLVAAQRETQSVLHREREITQALQRGLLPTAMPDVRPLDVAARFEPAGGTVIGGDTYDVIRLGPGRAALLIADVCGKGPEAAGLTGLVRHTARALASREGSPAAVLEALDDAVGQSALTGTAPPFCSAIYAVADATEAAVAVTLGRAGHPLPIVLRRSGAVQAIESDGGALGLPVPFLCEEQRIRLEAGDALVLYTDGVSEAGRPGPMLGQTGVEQLLASSAGGDAAQLADVLVDAARQRVGEGDLRDDVAVVVLRAAGR